MGYMSRSKGSRFVYLDDMGLKWRDDSFDAFFGQDVRGRILFVEGGYELHLVFDTPLANKSQMVISPYAGLRYAALDVMVNYSFHLLEDDVLHNAANLLNGLTQPPPPDGADDQWLDVTLGVIADLPVGRRSNFLLKVDGAGFGLGQSRYGNAAAIWRFQLWRSWLVGAGYRAARATTEPGGGNDLRLGLDLQFNHRFRRAISYEGVPQLSGHTFRWTEKSVDQANSLISSTPDRDMSRYWISMSLSSD